MRHKRQKQKDKGDLTDFSKFLRNAGYSDFKIFFLTISVFSWGGGGGGVIFKDEIKLNMPKGQSSIASIWTRGSINSKPKLDLFSSQRKELHSLSLTLLLKDCISIEKY